MKEWTPARFRSFVISQLRGARWPAKFDCIKKAYVKDGVNPRTGRKCKLHRCEKCGESFPKNKVQADHIEPVVGVDGFQGWDLYIERMFCGPEGFQCLCKGCHADKTLMERYKIKEEDLEAHKKLIAFKKMKAAQQAKLLSQLKLGCGTNGRDRIGIYKKHLKL